MLLFLIKGGYGLDKDLAKAAEYYKKSAPYHTVSKGEYGAKLYWGEHLPINEKQGLALMIEAANQGVIFSAYNVANLYFHRAFNLNDCGIDEEQDTSSICLLVKTNTQT